MSKKPITTFLWFDTNAQEATAFYAKSIPDCTITRTTHYGPGMPMPEGSVLTVEFDIRGQSYVALNGGKYYEITPGVSFMFFCDSQAQIDAIWTALEDGGKPHQCGWITDRFGVTWQIVTEDLDSMLQSSDKAASQRAWAALFSMVKIEIDTIRKAYKGNE